MASHSATALLHYYLILLTVCRLLGDGDTTSSMATRRTTTWTTKEGCMEVERDALLVYKAGVEDPADRLSSWHDQEDCCRWRNVVCDNRTGHAHVVKLNLQTDDMYWNYKPDERMALRGKILSSSLLSLTHLRSHNLSGNDFEWKQIPGFVGSFTRLKYLDLSWSNFGGTIPPQIGNLSTLRYLDLNSHFKNSITDYLLGFQLITPVADK
ncbi:hypothetical protein Cni_G11613 [Canna indica]|uniref:Leucine-rich repeat-containing N-terminal plant-type domain-containing protein n=1 Tax=Canna indica TaxID=4628 RepID=A0AAQ3Q9Q1_9LILI|nr:hypothetical protein Cni_G11613 [Canna indica]